MCIPEDCVTEVDQKKIYNPKTGQTAAEWDCIILLDYSEISTNDVMKRWPPHNTLILLEVKQILNISAVFEKLLTRVKNTVDCINFEPADCSTARKIKQKLIYQRGIFYPNPNFIVAIGARNVNNKIAEEIMSRGYLAVAPTGDFKVLKGDSTIKVFNSSLVEICNIRY